jgi:hypothetical protein
MRRPPSRAAGMKAFRNHCPSQAHNLNARPRSSP